MPSLNEATDNEHVICETLSVECYLVELLQLKIASKCFCLRGTEQLCAGERDSERERLTAGVEPECSRVIKDRRTWSICRTPQGRGEQRQRSLSQTEGIVGRGEGARNVGINSSAALQISL